MILKDLDQNCFSFEKIIPRMSMTLIQSFNFDFPLGKEEIENKMFHELNVFC